MLRRCLAMSGNEAWRGGEAAVSVGCCGNLFAFGHLRCATVRFTRLLVKGIQERVARQKSGRRRQGPETGSRISEAETGFCLARRITNDTVGT